MRPRPSRTPFTCPVCGVSLYANSKSCPGCGACERSGWSQDAAYDGLDLPDNDFDYDRFLTNEFGAKPKKTFADHLWWIITLLILAAMASRLLGG